MRYAVVGTGMMGLEHLRSIRALEKSEIVGVADPDGTSLAAGLEAAGDGAGGYESAEELLEHCEPDVVVVATPNHTHRQVLEAVWGRRVHVLVEKPLATRLPDLLAIRERAAEHDGIVSVGLEYRYVPAISALLAEVRRGTVGRVRTVAVREHRFPFLKKVGDWNRFNRFTGGTFVEKCCHFFDLMNLVTSSRPERVIASGGMAVNHLEESYDGERPDILDHGFVILEYPGGVRASLDLCMFAEGSRFEQELTVVGDEGKLEALVPGFMESLRGRAAELVVGSRGPDWPVEVRSVQADREVGYAGHHHGSTYLEHRELAAAILSRSRPAVSVDDGVVSVLAGLAAQQSIEEGRPIEVYRL